MSSSPNTYVLESSVFKEVKESQWSADHIARHGVTLDEVREAILARPYYRQRGRGGTWVVYGRSTAGRYLLVVLSDDGCGRAFVITARDMEDRERQLFRRKAR
ncbi:hypothetical protein SAMN05660874_01173 [Saccharopolyspora flava]|uniref:Uncharacterized protein n=1 Tax=Saccharopolyspora flava TaxID=95161 RepID=A0A1I6PWC3_9PSEU|nr:hypothetical protein SAMN05660874_01173 [Saccharopolyspora flava]